LNPWIKENHSQTQVICQALATAEQLMQQVIHCCVTLKANINNYVLLTAFLYISYGAS